MRSSLRYAAGLAVLLAAFELTATAAMARGGAANIMNSPGYQRRLQESRGYVTNQSGSLVTKPAPAVPHRHKWRRRH